MLYTKQNRSTEGCSKLKRSVDITSSGKNGLNIRTNASNIYSNIIVYQKYIGRSIKVGCATRSLYASSGPKAEGLTIRGDGDQDPVASAEV